MDYKHYMNIKVVVVVVGGGTHAGVSDLHYGTAAGPRLAGEAERNSSVQLSSHSSHLASGWQHQGCCLR